MIKKAIRKKRDKEMEKEYDQQYQKFSEKVKEFGLRILEVGSDGNCLFRSLADQMVGDQNQYAVYRYDIV